MLLFALLCPVLVWPLYLTVEKYGFGRTRYLIISLITFLIFMILASGIKYDRGYSWLGILLPLGGILLNHFIYLAIGFLSTDAETKIRIESRISEEIDLKAREDKVDEIISEWVCIKTYISSDQQYEYINDKELLDNAKIKYFVKSAGITNIFVDPKMADAAADILGLVNESNGEG